MQFADTQQALLRTQKRIDGVHSAAGFPLQGFKIHIFIGTGPYQATTTTRNYMWHVNMSAVRRGRPVIENTPQDIADIWQAVCILMHFNSVSPGEIVVVSDTSLKWPMIVAFCLLRWFGGLQPLEAEVALRRAAQHAYRLVDNCRIPIHVLAEAHEIQMLDWMKHMQTPPVLSDAVQHDLNHFIRVIPSTTAIRSKETTESGDHALPMLPFVNLRCRPVMGDLHQFSFSQYAPAGWACGSIALYACILSEWIPMQLWTKAIIESVILNGLWHARRYIKSKGDGFTDIEQQAQSMCPEMQYRIKDITDGTDAKVNWLDKLAAIDKEGVTTRLILTSQHKSLVSGHHVFMAFQNGYWYWLEPMEMNSDTMVSGPNKSSNVMFSTFGGSKHGSMLRVFDSLKDIASFAERLLHGTRWAILRVRCSRWNLTPIISAATSRVIMNSAATDATNDVTHRCYFIEQNTVTKIWTSNYTINHTTNQLETMHEAISYPFDIVMRPYFMVVSRVNMAPGTIIHIAKAKLEDTAHVGELHVHKWNEQFINTSPFMDPAIWLTRSGHSVMVGNEGAAIVPFMRRNSVSNTTWQQGSNGMYIVVKRPITMHTEIFSPHSVGE